MNYAEALAAIKSLDNGSELASAIETEVGRINAKNYDLIGEKRTETQKRQAMQTALESIGTSLKIEGDIDAILDSAQGKVQTLASERDAAVKEKETLETRATEAEGKVKTFERKDKFSRAATKAGANATVLEDLLGDKVEEFTISDDGVKVGDKTLRDYVEADDRLKSYIPVLFPDGETTPEPKKKTELPKGSPKGGDDKGNNPVAAHMNRYSGLSKKDK